MAAIAASSCGVIVRTDDDLLPSYLNSGGMWLERRSNGVSLKKVIASELLLSCTIGDGNF